MSLAVTPAVRKSEPTASVDTQRLYLWTLQDQAERKLRRLRVQDATIANRDLAAAAGAVDTSAQLQQQVTKLEAELKALRESMDKVNETLKALTPKK